MPASCGVAHSPSPHGVVAACNCAAAVDCSALLGIPAEMAGGASNVTFNINAVDAAGVEEVLLHQQGHIISMLRTAANSYGEEFMEEIDDQVLTPHQGFVSRR